ncbi:hypothetical protein SESBI_34853 [Sesbania bispinosa]|nr:hypothetical protein SESBI_34853 [Sesbania bispinosa]
MMERLGETFKRSNEVKEKVKEGPLEMTGPSVVPTPKVDMLHEIQTNMHVEVVAPNHLRFVDEPCPPDIERNQRIDEVVDMQEVVDASEEEDVEMVAETPLIR